MSFSSPPLWITDTLATFNLSGNVPAFKIRLQIWEKGALIFSETAFKGSAFKPSKPTAELLFKFFISKATSDSSVGVRKIDSGMHAVIYDL